MNFSASSIIANIVFGIIGMYVIGYGRKQLNYASVFIGAAMLFYTYFVTSMWAAWLIGFFLTGAAYLTR